MGQHFLADPNIVARIVETSGVGPSTQVLEVGPGTGALTVALAAAAGRVLAYEVDERYRPVLVEVLAGTDVEVRFADATQVDFDAELPPGEWTLVANLPYNVGTPILLDLLRFVPRITAMLVMVQNEVAERLAATPGSKVYGIPSVVAQIHSTVKLRFRVPPQVFVPPPNVGSAVVSLIRTPAPSSAEQAIRLAGAAFNQRRKMVRSSLAGVLASPEEVLERSGIPGSARAEDLSPDDYLRLAGAEDG